MAKRLTKKAFSEAPKYMVAIDYFCGKGEKHGMKPWQYWQTEPLEAQNLLEAMDEAEGWSNEDVYMLHLCERTSIVDDWYITYKAILANRGSGWHTHTDKHGENPTFGFKVDFAPYGGGFPYADMHLFPKEEE